MVTGPGNIYVVAAKRHLRGLIGIDAEAGPTEIAVLADEGADPRYVAADLISQAEHDPMAGSVLITPSRTLAEAVSPEIAAQVDRLATADGCGSLCPVSRARRAGRRSGAGASRSRMPTQPNT